MNPQKMAEEDGWDLVQFPRCQKIVAAVCNGFWSFRILINETSSITNVRLEKVLAEMTEMDITNCLLAAITIGFRGKIA